MTLQEITSEVARLLYKDVDCETNVAAVSNEGTRIVFETEDPVLVADLKCTVDDLEQENERLESLHDKIKDENNDLHDELTEEKKKTAQLTKDIAAYKALIKLSKNLFHD
jgi:peptidoglycan hydrolase CwlO-like protein